MNADKQVCTRRLANDQAGLVVEVFRMLADPIIGRSRDVGERSGRASCASCTRGAEHELAHAIPKLSHTIVHAYLAHEPALSS